MKQEQALLCDVVDRPRRHHHQGHDTRVEQAALDAGDRILVVWAIRIGKATDAELVKDEQTRSNGEDVEMEVERKIHP
jgi:hypothetical protein